MERRELDAMLFIASKCWSPDAASRPSIDQILKALCEIMLNSAIPPSDANTFWESPICDTGFRVSIRWDELIRLIPTTLTEQQLNVIGDGLCEKVGFMNNKVMTMQRWYQNFLWYGCWFNGSSDPLLLAMYDLFTKDWFHGTVDREEARIRMAQRPDGYFLVRMSNKDNNYPFTLMVQRSRRATGYNVKETLYFRIQRLSYSMSDKERFFLRFTADNGKIYDFSRTTIPSLISSLQKYKFLLFPCPKTSAASFSSYISSPEPIPTEVSF